MFRFGVRFAGPDKLVHLIGLGEDPPQCRFEGQSNKSVWVPVRTRMRVSSFWSQINSQSGSM